MQKSKKPNQTGSAFDVLAQQTVSVTIDGVKRRLNATEALQQSTFNDAMAGKQSVVKTVLGWVLERDGQRKLSPSHLPKISFERPDPIDVDAALLLLDIASCDTTRTREGGGAYLQLEPCTG